MPSTGTYSPLALASICPILADDVQLALFGGIGILAVRIGESWDEAATQSLVMGLTVVCGSGALVFAILLACLIGIPLAIRQRIGVLRKLAREMADNGIIAESTAQAIGRVESIRREGQRLGNWLTKDQAQQLLLLPDVATVKGLRDRAILAVLLCAGLRREECANLTVDHFQQRDARWVIVNLVGKRNKTRSVPVDSWVKHAIDTYCEAAGLTAGPLFLAMRRGDNLLDQAMTPQAIFDVVKTYAKQIGVNVRPHDLRRTFAKLSQKGGAAIQQIQFSLGHSSVQTTERYLGTQQDLTNAPSDVLGLHL